MKILLWHGYLLGGTGSNVYTRALAREWTRAGHDVTVFCQEPHPERYDLGGARSVRPDVGGLLPVFVLDRYEGYEVRLVQDCSRAELDGWVEANAAARARAAAGRPRLLQPRPARRAGRRGDRRPLRGQGARLRARVLDARQRRRSPPGGARRSPRAEAVFVGSGAHPRGARGRRRPRRPRARGAARASTSTSGGPRRATRRWPGCSRRRGATRRIPATRTSGCRTRATPSGSPRSSPATEPTVVYFGKLLYNKGVHVLLEALRGVDARAVIVGFGDYRAELERLGRPAHALHRPARAPAPRPPAAARGRHRRAVDLPRGVRHGRRRGGRRRLAAARRAPLRPGRGRRGARGRSTRRTSRTSPPSRPATRPSSREAGRAARAAGRRPRGARAQPPGARPWSAGAGPGSRDACSSRSTTLPRMGDEQRLPYDELLARRARPSTTAPTSPSRSRRSSRCSTRRRSGSSTGSRRCRPRRRGRRSSRTSSAS